MNCIYCKGEEEYGFSTFTANIGNCVIVIKNVPSRICKQCGEVTYSDEVFKQLEGMANNVRANYHPEVTIIKYAKPAIKKPRRKAPVSAVAA
jgi:YgiT-type zinc finger domain-containing protein